MRVRREAPVWRRANLPRWRPGTGQPPVLARQQPADRDGDHGLTLFAQAAEVQRQIFERVEGELLAPSIDQLLRQGADGLSGPSGVALDITPLDRVLGEQPIALPPRPVTSQVALHRLGLPRKRQVAGRHVRRHHRKQVVRRQHLVQHRHQRALHPVASGELRVEGVEEDHEHPRARVLGLRAHVGDVVGVAALLDRRAARRCRRVRRSRSAAARRLRAPRSRPR